MALIDSNENGATEIPGTSNSDSVFVFLAGPIRYWWTPGVWDTNQHKLYNIFRTRAHKDLSDEFLVYAPHRAWRGPWNEVAQQINDHAVSLCDVLVELKVPGVVGEGTEAEKVLAQDLNIPVLTLTTDATFFDQLESIIQEIKELKYREDPI